MSKLLPLYRDSPGDIDYTGRQHAPVCEWCCWRRRSRTWQYTSKAENGATSDNMCVCYAPAHNPASLDALWATVDRLNRNGQCESFTPTIWTRFTQALRLRPFVEKRR